MASRNDKGGVETRPDYRGEVMLDGVLYEISAWIKDGKNGKWMSLAIKPKPAAKPEKPAADDDADSIPF